MTERNGITELYRRCRPSNFKRVLGQDDAIRTLQGLLKTGLPHALILSGPSGTGKTTLARILREKVGCGESDYHEINAADARGIDTIRDIRQRMSLAPLGGRSRIWTIDEAARLTNDSQSALLKMLEDGPAHVYFILCTTDPQKLLPTIRTRCTEIKCNALDNQTLDAIMLDAIDDTGASVSEEVRQRIVECADGSARKALVLLEQVLGIEDEKEQLDAILKSDAKKAAIDIARLLINGAKWKEIAAIIKLCGEEPEMIRRCVLGYASSVLLSGFSERAYMILCAFEGDFLNSGRAGLVRAAFEVAREK